MARIALDSPKDLPAPSGGGGADVPGPDGDVIRTPFAGLDPGPGSHPPPEATHTVELAYDISWDDDVARTAGIPREPLGLVNRLPGAAA
jgi:hypothetical protein